MNSFYNGAFCLILAKYKTVKFLTMRGLISRVCFNLSALQSSEFMLHASKPPIHLGYDEVVGPCLVLLGLF